MTTEQFDKAAVLKKKIEAYDAYLDFFKHYNQVGYYTLYVKNHLGQDFPIPIERSIDLIKKDMEIVQKRITELKEEFEAL